MSIKKRDSLHRYAGSTKSLKARRLRDNQTPIPVLCDSVIAVAQYWESFATGQEHLYRCIFNKQSCRKRYIVRQLLTIARLGIASRFSRFCRIKPNFILLFDTLHSRTPRVVILRAIL